MSRSAATFDAVFTRLRSLMRKVRRGSLKARQDTPGSYFLIGPPTEMTKGKDAWFGGVRKGKAYVSYHLIGVYAFPDLLKGVSRDLRKRMQGKSCFNFTGVDDKLFKELAGLTEKSYKRLKRAKFLT